MNAADVAHPPMKSRDTLLTGSRLPVSDRLLSDQGNSLRQIRHALPFRDDEVAPASLQRFDNRFGFAIELAVQGRYSVAFGFAEEEPHCNAR